MAEGENKQAVWKRVAENKEVPKLNDIVPRLIISDF
jgi:hypothetical protein